MVPLSAFVIISRQDVPDYPFAAHESDCNVHAGLYSRESDCACPADSLSVHEVNAFTAADIAYIAPTVYLDQVDGFHLAFNPMGSAGVVMLNPPALQILSAFHQPRTLAEGVGLMNDPIGGLEAARQMVKLGLLDPVGGTRAYPNAPPQTLTAWLHVTNQCNLRCPYCYVHKTSDAMDLGSGRQAVEAVFRSALANGFRRVKLKYAGGEATLNFHTVLFLHDYAQKLAEIHGVTLEGVVLSNGVAITDRVIGELQARDIRLMISLDGIGQQHDTQRPFRNGRGSFIHVQRSLDKLAASNLKPTVSITISQRNLDGLSEVVAFILKRELPFTLNFYRENECSASFADLAYSDEQIIGAMKAAFAVIEADLPPYSLLGALVDRARLDLPHARPCGVGHSYIAIDHKGGVAKCHMEIERTVTDISAEDPLKLIREDKNGLQNMAVDEKEGCRACTWRYWCAGGCPALTYRVTGRYDIKSPNCRIYQALFPEVLRLEGLRLLKYCGGL